jgi:uncharacterized C2H2 Zn-finger protein
MGMLQDIQHRGRYPTQAEYAAIMDAVDTARDRSIGGIRSQYSRLELEPPPTPPSSFRTLSPTRVKTISNSSFRSLSPRRVSTIDAPVGKGRTPLFCGYSKELQRHPEKSLSRSFERGGKQRCPACDNTFDTESGRAWRITKDDAMPKAGVRDRTVGVPRFEPNVIVVTPRDFHVLNRFIVKCHREDGEFACFLCHRNRPIDTIWSTMKDLVRHVERAHDAWELEQDHDILEVA